MQINDSIPKARAMGLGDLIQLSAANSSGEEIPASGAIEAGRLCLFYVVSILTLLGMIDTSRFKNYNTESLTLNFQTVSELTASLIEEALFFFDVVDGERKRLVEASGREPKFTVLEGGKLLDEIATILSKTFALRGEQATVKDDQAVMMIRDLLFTSKGKEGASNESI